MAQTANTDETARQALRRDFGERWSIIRTRDTGRWWAFRRPAEGRRSWPMDVVTDVDADTPEQLAERLREVDTVRPR